MKNLITHCTLGLGQHNKSCWIRRKNNSPSKIFVAIKFFMFSEKFQWRITKKILSEELFQYVTRSATTAYCLAHQKKNKALQHQLFCPNITVEGFHFFKFPWNGGGIMMSLPGHFFSCLRLYVYFVSRDRDRGYRPCPFFCAGSRRWLISDISITAWHGLISSQDDSRWW